MNRTHHNVLKRPTYLAACLLLAFGAQVHALPAGGAVSAGTATIASGNGTMTVHQTSQQAAINWQRFSIGSGEAVRFVQPGRDSVALNRVLGPDPSSILGNLSANGRVFLVNPQGILFGQGAQVNVGGLVASTLNISDADLLAARHRFTGISSASVLNQGSINADAGHVALLGARVANDGQISANLGSVSLAAGQAMTLDLGGDGMLRVAVDQGAVDALARNGGLIRAHGGQVLLSARSASSLLGSAVNNSGVIEAHTLSNVNGVIRLMGDMQSGRVNVGGRLDASAPNGGDGGFIETSAAKVVVASDARVTTFAALGQTGQWLIDPQDFTIGSNAGDNISGPTLSALLVTNSVTITTNIGPDATVAGTPPVTSLNTASNGNGDIHVNEAVSWTAAPSTTTLTLNAARDVNINRAITATNGNLVVCCGRDINVNAAITTTNGSVLMAAGRNVNINAAMTTTDGNLTICAANDIGIGAAITLTRGSGIAAQSLGLATGLVLNAGTGGTGPGVGGGTVVFAPLTPPATVTGPNAPVTIHYNPTAYTTPSDFSANFTLSLGATLTQRMLVFPGGADKTFDGTTVATFTSLKGQPAGVTLVAGPGSSATFDSPTVGNGKIVSFTGFSLAGADAGDFALPQTCCGPIVGQTTANIIPVVVVLAPPAPDLVAPVPDLVAPAPDLVAPAAIGLGRSVINLVGSAIAMPPTMVAYIPVPPEVVMATSAVGAAPAPPPPVPAPVAQAPAIAETPPVVAPTPEQPYVPPQRARKADRN